MKCSVHNYHPHKYPIAANMHLKPFVRNRNLENQVGMRCFYFWELLDKLKNIGLKMHRHLDVDAKVALYHTKLRYDISL